MAAGSDILIDTLTAEQRDVILHGDGPLLVIAGPGAGKTEVMLRRVAYLVRERGVVPESLLVMTFTRKATEELRYRLARFLGRDADRIMVTTIHGFCQWLLETYPQAHPYGKSFQVLDERAQYLFILSHAKELGLDLPKGRLGDFLGDVIAAFNAYSEELVDANRLTEVLHARGADDAQLAAVKAYGRYGDLLAAERVIDFAGLQRVAYGILRDDEAVRGEVQGHFRYVVVDEHQDTNAIQDLIIGFVAEPQNNLCVVGDDDQSIYRFRGATVQNFLTFPDAHQAARRVELGRNFRSTTQIVDTTTRLIENNPLRYAKVLVAHRGPGPEVVLIQAEDVDDEGERLAQFIESLHERRVITRWAAVTVLFSSVRYYAEPLVSALEHRQVPYVVLGNGRFFDREDIQQLKELIITLGWPNYWRLELFDGPILALQPDTMDALQAYTGNVWALDEVGLSDLGVVDSRDLVVLPGLIRLQRKVQAREHGSILGLVHDLLALSGYVAQRIRADDQTALLNIAQFTQLAEAFDQHGRSRSTYRFGEYLRSLPERSLDELQAAVGDAVQIMTIHQAKGLEFPVVVIPSVIEGRLPKRARERRLLIPQDIAPQVMPPEIAARRQEPDPDTHVSDQRRLLYVGLTRARDLLAVGTSERVRKQRCKPSRFLAEMGLACRESYAIEGQVAATSAVKTATPLHLSFSAINAFLTCPLRYKLIYEDGFSAPTWHFAQFGTSLHHTLEAIHRQILGGEPVDEAKALALFEEHWIAFGARLAEMEAQFKRAGRDYVVRYVRENAASLRRVRQAELAFMRELAGCVLSGQIDLIRELGDGKLEIVDFKTRSAAGIAVTRTDLQLGLYALACEGQLAAPIERLTLHLLADGQEEHFEWGPEERQRVGTTLDRVMEGLLSKDRRATPGGHCHECEFRALCGYGEVR